MMAGAALTPPHSVQAEQAVLGALLMDHRAFDAVGDLLKPEHFYVPEYRAIYSTMARLILSCKVADVVTVFEAGGHDLASLNELANCVTSVRSARRHAEIVLERWMRREAMRLAMSLMEDAAAVDDLDHPVSAVLETAVAGLMKLSERRMEQEPKPVSELLPQFIDEFNEMAEGKVITFKTGLHDLDVLTAGGGRRGETWVIGARPSMGKSASSLTMALSLSKEEPTLVLTQEDSITMFLSRAVANVGRVNLAHLRNPRRAAELGEIDQVWKGVAQGVDDLALRQLMVDDQGGLTLADVRRKVRQAKRRMPRLALVVVDYLQLMSGEEGDNRNQMLGAIANGLNKLAKDENVWIVLLSQLSRKADERTGVPQMADLRDSGDIEGAAHVILLLHREHKRNPKADKHWGQIHVCKQKNGPTDTINVHFDGAYQRFSDWVGPAPSMLGVGKASHSGGLS